MNRATDQASDVAAPVEREPLQNPVARHGAALLSAALRGLERHRAAVLAQDAAATARAVEALSPVLTELMELIGPSPDVVGSLSAQDERLPTAEAAELARLAGQVREQLLLNRALVANGTAIADHYALCIAQASPGDCPGLLSEVA